MTPSDQNLLHTSRFPVRWGDMDALGHVNNAVYFTYFEQARVEMLGTLGRNGWPDAAHGGPVLASIQANFRKPLEYPATVIVRVYGGRSGRSSFSLHSELTVEADENTLYADADAMLVWVDREHGRPTALPEAIRALLPV